MYQSERSTNSYLPSFVEDQEDGGSFIVAQLRSCHGDSFATSEAESEVMQPHNYDYYNGRHSSSSPPAPAPAQNPKEVTAPPPATTSEQRKELPADEVEILSTTSGEKPKKEVSDTPKAAVPTLQKLSLSSISRPGVSTPHMVTTPRHGFPPSTTAEDKQDRSTEPGASIGRGEAAAAEEEEEVDGSRPPPSYSFPRRRSFRTPFQVQTFGNQPSPRGKCPCSTVMTIPSTHRPAPRRARAVGPLILVQRPRRPVPSGTLLHTCLPLSTLEEQAYENQLLRLQEDLHSAHTTIAGLREKFDLDLETLSEQKLTAYKEDERERRQQFQQVLQTLKEENKQLTETLREVERREKAETARREQGVPSATQQVEWERRLGEVEGYWRDRLRQAEARWEETSTEQSTHRQSLLTQIRELTRAATQLEEKLNWVEREKADLEKELQQYRGVASGVVARVDRKGPGMDVVVGVGEEENLRQQLERYRATVETMKTQHEAEVAGLKELVARERARGAKLVDLYSNQIQCLHQQLAAAVQPS